MQVTPSVRASKLPCNVASANAHTSLNDISMTLPLLPLLPEIGDRIGGSPRIIMLDVDGTLAPIAPRPQDALVPPATRRAIAALAARPDVHVAIVSGRGAADARRLVSVGNIWVIGNHGLEIVGPQGESEVVAQAESFRVPMAQASRRFGTSLSHVAGVLLEA